MGALLSCLCRCRKKTDAHKKDDAVRDVEGGLDHEEGWEPDPQPVAPEPEPEPEQEPEDDPFADMGMAPVVSKTRRHNAVRPCARARTCAHAHAPPCSSTRHPPAYSCRRCLCGRSRRSRSLRGSH